MSDPHGKIIEIPVKQHMEKSFLDYAMSVISDRAIPDVRDGLKPVHRRILFAMHQNGNTAEKAYVKSARIVGNVIGTLHPHGDVAVYDAAVRMAQSWSLLHPLIDPQGNFGSMDGDPPAAQRYTEMRMSKLSQTFFETIEKEVVNTRPNFDATIEEPTVLPALFPNILVNGTDGIAVGMATSLPTHNLGEVIDAFLAFVANPDITLAEIMQIMPAPDFPTGGIVHGLDGYAQALETGRGSVKLRGEWHEEQRRGGAARLVVTELPWRVNKARLVESIADLVRDKKIDDIVGLNDESAKKQVRIVVDLAKGASAEVVANQLFAMTELETSINYNMTLLLGQQPSVMNVFDIFRNFLEFRIDVIKRAAEFDLKAALKKLHIYEGYLKALDALDETIKTIRASKDRESAREALIKLLDIDTNQAQAILELQLQRLTNMDMGAIRSERESLLVKCEDLRDIIARRERRLQITIDDATGIKSRYSEERRTTIAQELSTITREDLITKEDVIVLATSSGYVKRVPVSQINQQNRGTRGKRWMDVGDDDTIASLMSASSHDVLLAFSDTGQLHAARVYEIPESAAGTKGRHVKNVLDGLEGEVINLMAVNAFDDEHFLVTVSAAGNIKRTALSAYENATRKGGIRGVKIEEGDTIVGADIVREYDHVILVSSGGKAIRFEMNAGELRPMGRDSVGNRGMRIGNDEKIVGMIVLRGEGKPHPMMMVDVERDVDGKMKIVKEEVQDTRTLDYGRFLFVIGVRGVGKKTPVSEFSAQSRGGKGVLAFNINSRTGELVKALGVTADQDLVMTTKKGVTNRIRVDAIRTSGRATAGTSLIKPDDGDAVVAVSPVVRAEEEAAE